MGICWGIFWILLWGFVGFVVFFVDDGKRPDALDVRHALRDQNQLLLHLLEEKWERGVRGERDCAALMPDRDAVDLRFSPGEAPQS